MNTHELLCTTNWQLIHGKSHSTEEKEEIVRQLLASAAEISQTKILHPDKPVFFVTTERLMTINGVKPKTLLFSANHYELEILRLLALWAPENARVAAMLARTRERLRAANRGIFPASSESLAASICVLRFLTAAFPDDERWIAELVAHLRAEIDKRPKGKTRHSGISYYYWLALTDVDLSIARPEILRYEQRYLRAITRTSSYNIAYDKLYNPIAIYIIRNLLARLPEYQHIKDITGHEGSDGRFHFNFRSIT